MSVTQISLWPGCNGKQFVQLKKSASLGTCLKSKAEMWLTTHGMRDLYKAKQVRVMWYCGELLGALATT